jgi:hypothetical protein
VVLLIIIVIVIWMIGYRYNRSDRVSSKCLIKIPTTIHFKHSWTSLECLTSTLLFIPTLFTVEVPSNGLLLLWADMDQWPDQLVFTMVS